MVGGCGMSIKKAISNGMRFGLFVVLIALETGCSKINTDNYNQIKAGMQYDEVTALLGKADECNGIMGIKSCTWGDKDRYIMVNFADDKVIVFSAKGL